MLCVRDSRRHPHFLEPRKGNGFRVVFVFGSANTAAPCVNNGSTFKKEWGTKQKATTKTWDSVTFGDDMTSTVGRMFDGKYSSGDNGATWIYVSSTAYQSAASNRIQILAAEHLPVDD